MKTYEVTKTQTFGRTYYVEAANLEDAIQRVQKREISPVGQIISPAEWICEEHPSVVVEEPERTVARRSIRLQTAHSAGGNTLPEWRECEVLPIVRAGRQVIRLSWPEPVNEVELELPARIGEPERDLRGERNPRLRDAAHY